MLPFFSGYGGKYSQEVKVILVATHADQCNCPRQPSGELVSGQGNILLYEVKKTFGKVLDICEMLFILDAKNSQSKDIKLLRTHLSNLRNSYLKVRMLNMNEHSDICREHAHNANAA